MNSETTDKIDSIFRSILGNDYAGDLASEETPPIDSIAYVELLITLQNEFKIKFSTQEFFSLRSVKNIKESLLEKLK